MTTKEQLTEALDVAKRACEGLYSVDSMRQAMDTIYRTALVRREALTQQEYTHAMNSLLDAICSHTT